MASKVNPRSCSTTFNKQNCFKCNKNVFQLEKIIVGDHSLHESCFVCEKCNSRLTTGNYEEIDGSYYCLKDSHAAKRDKGVKKNTEPTSPRTTGKICPLCKKRVFSAEGVVLDNEDLVHRSCFVCSECKAPLSLGNFHTIEEKFFCTRHFFQRTTSDSNVNGRKKARDLFGGALDADPLQQALTDLEKQEKKQSSEYTAVSTEEPISDQPESKPEPEHESNTNTDEALPVPLSVDQNTNPTNEDNSKNNIVPKLDTKNDIESDEHGKDPDTARSVSVSVSETDYLDLTEEDEKGSGKESDVYTASDKSEGNTSKITHPDHQLTEKDGTEESSTKLADKPKEPPRKKKFGRKDTDDKDSKKKSSSKKKRKLEKSERSDETEDASTPTTKKRNRRDKSQRKLKKQGSSLKDVDDIEDSKEEKKKKGKRGLFSLKKKSSSRSVRKSSVDEGKDTSHSPSLTSFVSSRFRKQKKDQSSSDSLPTTPVKSSPKDIPKPNHPIATEIVESDDEEDLEPLTELAPLSKSPDKKNRISRLNRGDSKDVNRSPSNQTSGDSKAVVQKVQPVCIDIPNSLDFLAPLDTCANTLEEDIPLEALNLPKSEGGPVYSWSSYELSRDFPPLELNLPDDVLPEPNDEKEKIQQKGFFEPSVINFGLIGAHRRLLELVAILTTTYPFETKFVNGTDISPLALEILRERHGSSFNLVSKTELLATDLDWIFVGSMHHEITENIIASLSSGKNVFCEKPICFSVKDCLRLRDAHKQSGKKFFGGFVWRLVPFYQEVFDVLRCGILGDIVSVEINNLLDPSEAGLLMSGWSRKRKLCNNPLFDTFCFEIDVLNWLLESIPSRVGSFGGLNIFTPQNKPATKEELEPFLDWTCKPLETETIDDPFSADKDIEDNHVIMMEYRNNTRAVCHINTNSAFPQRRIMICGVKGTLEGDLYTGTIRYRTIAEQYETNVIQVTPGKAHGGSDQQIMEDLIDSTRNLPVTCFDGEELFPSIITTLGIDESKQKGTIIDLEPQWKQLGI